ncbi:hypothetical protein MAR_014875, partial [Mya arenaria]
DDDTSKYLIEKEDQLKVYAAVVSIQVETGPREVHLNEIYSLEQASAAWISRRELIAQIRNVTKIDFQNYAADIVSPNEEQVKFVIDANILQRYVEQVHGKLERFGISKSLDHIRTFLDKHEDVSNVKVHIVLPKINVNAAETKCGNGKLNVQTARAFYKLTSHTQMQSPKTLIAISMSVPL